MVYSLCLRYGFPAIIEKCNLFDHLPGTLIDLFHLRKKLQLPIACAHLLRLIKLVSIGQYRLNTFQITSKFLVHFVIWLQFSKPLQSLLELYFTLFTIDFLPVGDSFTANPIMKTEISNNSDHCDGAQSSTNPLTPNDPSKDPCPTSMTVWSANRSGTRIKSNQIVPKIRTPRTEWHRRMWSAPDTLT